MGVGDQLFRVLVKLNRFLYFWLSSSFLVQPPRTRKIQATQEVVQELILIKTRHQVYSLPIINNRALRIFRGAGLKEVSMFFAIDHEI